MKKNKKKDPIRKQKDLKILQSHIYVGLTDLDFLAVQIMDRKTGKVYAGNIQKTFNKLKHWKERYKEK